MIPRAALCHRFFSASGLCERTNVLDRVLVHTCPKDRDRERRRGCGRELEENWEASGAPQAGISTLSQREHHEGRVDHLSVVCPQ